MSGPPASLTAACTSSSSPAAMRHFVCAITIARSTPSRCEASTSVRSTSSVTRAPAFRRIFASPGRRPSMRERLDARVHAGEHREPSGRVRLEPGEPEAAGVGLVRGEDVGERCRRRPRPHRRPRATRLKALRRASPRSRARSDAPRRPARRCRGGKRQLEPGEADRRDARLPVVDDRRADADDALAVLLVVDRELALPHALELDQELLDVRDRRRRPGGQSGAGDDRAHALLRQVREEGLADRAAVRQLESGEVALEADDPGAVDPADDHREGLVEDADARRPARLLRHRPQRGQGDSSRSICSSTWSPSRASVRPSRYRRPRPRRARRRSRARRASAARRARCSSRCRDGARSRRAGARSRRPPRARRARRARARRCARGSARPRPLDFSVALT